MPLEWTPISLRDPDPHAAADAAVLWAESLPFTFWTYARLDSQNVMLRVDVTDASGQKPDPRSLYGLFGNLRDARQAAEALDQAKALRILRPATPPARPHGWEDA